MGRQVNSCPVFPWQASYEGNTNEGVEYSLGKVATMVMTGVVTVMAVLVVVLVVVRLLLLMMLVG